MRIAIKLVVAFLMLHAVYRIGVAYWQHYTFEDAVQQTVQFADTVTNEELSTSIVALAEEHEIPLEPEDVVVTRDRRHLNVEATYHRDVEILPRFQRPFSFSLNATAVVVN